MIRRMVLTGGSTAKAGQMVSQRPALRIARHIRDVSGRSQGLSVHLVKQRERREFAISRHDAPELWISSALFLEERAQGRPGIG
jgi:hypothetical protein